MLEKTNQVFKSFQIKLTLLIRGEGVTVAMFLQLLPELHDVTPFHKALTAKNTTTELIH